MGWGGWDVMFTDSSNQLGSLQARLHSMPGEQACWESAAFESGAQVKCVPHMIKYGCTLES